MRILFNGLLARNRSGTGRYIVELAAALANEPHVHDIRYAWPRQAPIPSPQMETALIQCSDAAISRLFFEHRGATHLCKCLDCAVAHYPASIAPGKCAVPSIVTVHDLCCLRHPEWFSRSRRWYYQRVMGPGIKAARHIIADSQATADDIVRLLEAPAARITTIPLGVGAEFFPASAEARARLRQSYRLPRQYILFVGTIEPRKNLSRVISAWASIADAVPDLVIAGRRGWLTPPEALAAEAPAAADRIHWLDHVSQEHLPALYSEAVALVWPSLMEGFGLPVLEAMACGAPVVTSNTSSMPEVAGDAALLVNPQESAAIAEAMRALCEDQSLRERLREKGLEQAGNFTWERTARATIAVYDQVAAELGAR